MARFQVYILGCGSALPNLKHNTSSQVVEVHDKLFMVDCGEGTQLQLRKSRILHLPSPWRPLLRAYGTHLHFRLVG